MTSHTSL